MCVTRNSIQISVGKYVVTEKYLFFQMQSGSKGKEKKEKEKNEKEKRENEKKEKEKKQAQSMNGNNSDSEESDAEEYIEEEGGIKIGDIYIPPAPPAVCSVESKGPRLVITHIENENFKSYAGRRVLGPFHKVSGATDIIVLTIISLIWSI